jgi:hypothetical protein
LFFAPNKLYSFFSKYNIGCTPFKNPFFPEI